MLNRLDNFLNAITMYRLVLYVLLAWTAAAVALGYAGILPFTGGQLLVSAAVLVAACIITNRFIARVLRVPVNVESDAITGLILFFVMAPAYGWQSGAELAAVGALAMASKYVFNWHKKHIFNPAAAGAVLAGFAGLGANAWWIADVAMVPAVAVLGFLVVRKLRRFDVVIAFITASFLATAAVLVLQDVSVLIIAEGLWYNIARGPLLFFATIMLTEPLTTPPTRRYRLLYGALVGVLFSAPFTIGSFYLTPEAALVIGNAFSFAVSLKRRVVLRLKEKAERAPKIFEFIFRPDRRLAFNPGQYLEWTVPHRRPDSRGNRRYFTIASSPTEPDVRLAVKIGEAHSSYKQALLDLAIGDTAIAGQLQGDFTLPRDSNQKLAFIAGGVGITPFRSMVKYLIDTKQTRDIVLLYHCTRPDEFVYADVFESARPYGIRTVYFSEGAHAGSPGLNIEHGSVDQAAILAQVPDYAERTYYLSGPPGMVDASKRMLRSLRIPPAQIRTDYFIGY